MTSQSQLHVFTCDRDDLPFVKRGEPHIAELPSCKILHEPSRYLRLKVVNSGRRSSKETWRAAAYNLKTWLEFLRELDVDWMHARSDHFLQYRDGLATTVSRSRGRVFASSSIANLMMTVLDFYQFLTEQGGYVGDLGRTTIIAAHPMPRHHEAATSGGPTEQSQSKLIDLVPPRSRRGVIRPFTIAEWRKVSVALGPMPSELDEASRAKPTEQMIRGVRDRLLAEIPFNVGLRIKENRFLLEGQFLELSESIITPSAYNYIDLDPESTKRKKGGIVRVPNWLISEVLHFIDMKSAFYGKADGRPLFSSSRLGMDFTRMSSRRMEQILENAQIISGVVRRSKRFDVRTGEELVSFVAKHCFHDLRHSYAVWTYVAKKISGDSDPWKWIQFNLRHDSLQTTIDIYVTYVKLTSDDEDVLDLRTLLWRESDEQRVGQPAEA